MKTMNVHYTLLFSLGFLFVVAGATHLINQTCKNSSKNDPNINYKFCVYALQSAPASRCANITRLGLISITLVKHNVTDTRCSIKQLLQDKKVDKKSKVVLEDCLELYSDSLSTLSEAAEDYRAKRFVDANVKVSSVMEASTTCEEGFRVSPLTVENNRIFQLSAVALSIMNIFHTADK